MKIIEFIITNWSEILLLTLTLAAIIYAICKKDFSLVRQQLFSLVTEAEKKYGGGTGVLKLASVVAAIYPQLPKLFRMFVTEKMLVRMIESVLTEAKKKWESNKKLLEESESRE